MRVARSRMTSPLRPPDTPVGRGPVARPEGLPVRRGPLVPLAQRPVGRPMGGPAPSGLGGAPARPIIRPAMPILGSMKHGGKVKKTGLFRLHKGENVVPLSSLRRAKRNM